MLLLVDYASRLALSYSFKLTVVFVSFILSPSIAFRTLYKAILCEIYNITTFKNYEQCGGPKITIRSAC